MGKAGDLKRHRVHYDVTVMQSRYRASFEYYPEESGAIGYERPAILPEALMETLLWRYVTSCTMQHMTKIMLRPLFFSGFITNE